MNRAKSLILSESAFYNVATTSVSDEETRQQKQKQRGGGLVRRYSSFDLSSTSGDNEPILAAAKKFLTTACPELLTILENHPDDISARDRLVKIGRNLNASLRYGQEATERKNRGESALMDIWSEEEEDEFIGTKLERKARTDDNLQRLVKECQDLAKVLSSPVKVPTVRYGRTELQMPIVTLGCMRFQQSWNRGGTPITTPEQIEKECQDNLVKIIKHALHCGVNHIETAQGYGCSEMQIGMALKTLFDEGVCKREDLIIQTKGGISSSTSKSDYKSQILGQIKGLGLDYVDLFSVHGLNADDHYDWLFHHGEKGNLIDALRELRAEGKIRWIGFSTHAPAHVIERAIESDAFDYLNLHYHFMGAYTASGDGNGSAEGNLDNIRLAHEHDMGVFIISPYDKGGRLYTPSHLSRELMLPEMEPMEYGSAWIWHHEKHIQGDKPAPCHTLVCGAARPSDLDQPVMAALRSITEEGIKDFQVVSRRIEERKERVLGKEWAATWHVGLPNYSQSEQRGFQIGNMVWLYNAIQVFGMLDMAKDRYATLVGNSKKWDPSKAWKDNVFGSCGPGFHWMPGCAYDPSCDFNSELKDVPEGNMARVIEAMKFVHEWCCPEGSKSMMLEAGVDEKKENDVEKKAVPLEWQAAYDMRPWTAFPER
eukprot:CAMPEP_0183732296 /NCGR_PEP_ID=MMETSP0737-20130205/38101_1 /TAXON_ID=385413 /ORGANISM="Thalassiosira miniscula, Strain CCMP1093" /LENGTH=654 /DNA_ID=CAMNT_0025965273 /DNA_START=28 /DNA_END=1992 /DNA_ORIENTATION=+